jgi:glycosyltransferase involved in cell wall biosynthesis
VVVDDRSTDDSLAAAVDWARANAARFNRILVLRNRANSGLAFTRNVGFDAADTPFVLPLDADNRMLPDCAAACLRTARVTGAAFAYPLIRRFGAAEGLLSEAEYDPGAPRERQLHRRHGPGVQAAWAAVGGYDHIRGGWEDFDFWCRLVERGLRGERVPGGPLAEYRDAQRFHDPHRHGLLLCAVTSADGQVSLLGRAKPSSVLWRQPSRPRMQHSRPQRGL